MKRNLLAAVAVFGLFADSSAQNFDMSFLPRIKASADINSIVETPDGAFLVAGDFIYVGETNSGQLVKIDSTGKMIASFAHIYTDHPISKVIALPDGKILIQGIFANVNGTPCNRLVQLNADGTIDATFQSKASFAISNFAVDDAGKIYVIQDNSVGTGASGLARLNSDGSIDYSFKAMSGDFGAIINVIPTPVGIYTCDDNMKLLRLQLNGNIDNTFKSVVPYTEPLSTDEMIYLFAAQPDNKPIISIGRTLMRLNVDGNIDTTFNNSDDGEIIRDARVRKNGHILVYRGGEVDELNSDGSANWATPGVPESPYSPLDNVIELGNEKILVGGQSINLLTKDGAIDAGFVVPELSGVPQGTLNGLAVTFGDKVLFTNGGDFRKFGMDSTLGPMFRLNPNGTRDTTFHFPYGAGWNAFPVVLQEDNKIYTSGVYGVIRLWPSGKIDTSFNIGSGVGSNGFVTKIFYNGSHVYFGGAFDSFRDQPTRGLVRVNKDGTTSQLFNNFPGQSSVNDFDVQSDGGVICFIVDQMGAIEAIIRLNPDGTIDDHFERLSQRGLIGVKVDAKDRIYVWGTEGFLQRLNKDGSLDASFSGGGFASDPSTFTYVSCIENLPSGEIAVGGQFTSYNGHKCPGIVILGENGTYRIPTPVLDPSSVVRWIKYSQGSLYVGGNISMNLGTSVTGIGKIVLDREEIPTPVNPQLLYGTYNKADGLTLNWMYGSGAEDGFELQRSVDNDLNFATYSILYPKTFSTIDQNLEVGKKYFYRVNAFNSTGRSSFTNTFVYPDDLIMAVQNNGENLRVYPNPARDLINIEGVNDFVSLTITDQLGRDYRASNIANENGALQVNIDNLPRGVLVFVIRGQNSVARAKVVKY